MTRRNPTMKILGIFTSLIIVLLLFPKGQVLATRASLLCEPGSGNYNVGDTITVSYKLDTRSFSAYGADIVATFTPSVLEAVGTASTPGTADTKWTAPTTNTIDASLGKIRLDFGKNQASFSGTTNIGQATFKAKAAGQAQFNFVFFQQYDDTTIDGGAAKVWGIKTEGGTISNILTDVTNCMYVIASTGPTSTPGPIGSSGPTVPPVTELPRSGTGEVTVALLGLAFIFIGGGLIFPLYAATRR